MSYASPRFGTVSFRITPKSFIPADTGIFIVRIHSTPDFKSNTDFVAERKIAVSAFTDDLRDAGAYLINFTPAQLNLDIGDYYFTVSYREPADTSEEATVDHPMTVGQLKVTERVGNG